MGAAIWAALQVGVQLLITGTAMLIMSQSDPQDSNKQKTPTTPPAIEQQVEIESASQQPDRPTASPDPSVEGN